MIDLIIAFSLGMIVGAFFGILCLALCAAGKEN